MGCSSWETSGLAASSSALEAAASWLDEGCHHLFPDGGVGILGTVGGEAVNGSSLPIVASCQGDFWGSCYAFHGFSSAAVVILMRAASSTSLVSSWRGYIKVPWASGGQACTTAQNASAKA